MLLSTYLPLVLMNPEHNIIAQAAAKLVAGELVAVPTETVYGLGADALNSEAVKKIFALKGRPADHPLIVHIGSDAKLDDWAINIPDNARKLVAKFWPGPLTLILKKSPHVPDVVTGGQDSVGLRCPSHPIALALLSAFAKIGSGAIAAPSANKFGHISPTTAAHVREEFGTGLFILDGGASEVGIESTILDLSRAHLGIPPVLLRPGAITAQQIADVIGVIPGSADAAAPRASGSLEVHYAPTTPMLLVPGDVMDEFIGDQLSQGKVVALLQFDAVNPTNSNKIISASRHVKRYAHDLYANLRTLDNAFADVILVELPPTSAEWAGVNDRLKRAASRP